MRIGFSEPEPTSGILSTQESQPSNVIGPVTSMPVSSGPVEALGHDDSAAIGSTSSSAPVHSSSPTQALGPTTFAFGVPMQASPFGSAPPTQSLGPTAFAFGARTQPPAFGSCAFDAPRPSTFGSMQGPTFGSGASPVHSSAPIRFGSAPAFTSISSAAKEAPAFGSVGLSAAPTTSIFGSTQAPALGSVGLFAAPTPSPLGSTQAPAQATSGSGAFGTPTPSPFRSTQDSVQAPSGSAGAFGTPTPSPFGSTQAPVQATFGTPTPSAFGSMQDRVQATFGSDATSTSTPTPSPFGSMQVSSGFGAFGTSAPSAFGSMQAPVQATFGSDATSTSKSFSFGPAQVFASHDRSHDTEQDRRYARYAPTLDGHDLYISISASCNSNLHKSHEEIRWEDYEKRVKASRPNVVFSASSASPSIFASRSIFDHPQWTRFGTMQGNMTTSSFGFFPAGVFGQTSADFTGFRTQFPSSFASSYTAFPAAHTFPISSGAKRPHETTASGCTACGAMSSSSASGYFNFNGASIPLSAASSLPGLFFSTSGSCPMMFGTTTPALQAYPVHGFILLPFASMN